MKDTTFINKVFEIVIGDANYDRDKDREEILEHLENDLNELHQFREEDTSEEGDMSAPCMWQ